MSFGVTSLNRSHLTGTETQPEDNCWLLTPTIRQETLCVTLFLFLLAKGGEERQAMTSYFHAVTFSLVSLELAM